MNSLLERWFHLSEAGTTIRTEILAGLTTFVAPALIIVGAFMMRNVGRIAWTELQEFFPAFRLLSLSCSFRLHLASRMGLLSASSPMFF